MNEIIIELAVLITSLTTIYITIKKIVMSSMKEIISRVDELDFNQCKTYLTNFLADVEKGEIKDSEQMSRASEIYDHYSRDLNGNSYITNKWKKLMK